MMTDIPDVYVIATVMIILAEPHFGASWPYIFNRKYHDIFKSHAVALIYIPIGIVLSAVFVFFFFGFTIFSYLFLAANMYHVNKQSLGMVKIQGLNKKAFKPAELDCHIPSIVFLAFHAFALEGTETHVPAFLLLFGVITYIVWRLPPTDRSSSEPLKHIHFYSSALQMCCIWFPLALFSNPLLALAVGVSIHYVQYLLFTGHVFFSETSRNLIILFVVVYAVFATSIQSFGVNTVPWIILCAAIPQLLHFYLDGFFWKFSNPTIRDRLTSSLF
jgi:hypothetical protein